MHSSVKQDDRLETRNPFITSARDGRNQKHEEAASQLSQLKKEMFPLVECFSVITLVGHLRTLDSWQRNAQEHDDSCA